MPSNVFDTLVHLKRERYRTAIIHAAPDKSPSLSSFSQKVCQQSNGKYLDLLDYFIQNPSLSENIDTFSLEKLLGLLKEQSKGQTLLFVDRADFLLDTWRKSERQSFYRLFINQWDGFRDGMKSALIFSLQTSNDIEGLKIIDSQGQSRVFRLTDFSDIG